MFNLEGKYAIVTGCGKGIGACIVKRFLEGGAAGVAMLEYDEELVKKTAAELDPSGERTLPIRCDVSNGEMVKEAVAKAVEKFGTVDVLVNNAGITRDAMFHKMTEAQWDSVLNVNLKSMFYTCKEVIPIMRAKNYGKIVNISSVSALGNVGQANYAASKAAIQGFTKTLAKESGPKNITVNAVAPGYIATDMLKTVPASFRQANPGFDPEWPHADWLKRKTFTFSYPLSEKEVASPKFLDQLLTLCKAGKPINDFLNYTVDNQ